MTTTMTQPVGARCRGPHCKTSVLWVAMPSTKRMLIDAAPRADGNIKLIGTKLEDGTPLAVFITKHEQETWDGPRYVSHFATCPDRQSFRKKADAKTAKAEGRK